MSVNCSNLLEQLSGIFIDKKILDLTIEKYINSNDDPSVKIEDKIKLLRKIYKTRKDILSYWIMIRAKEQSKVNYLLDKKDINEFSEVIFDFIITHLFEKLDDEKDFNKTELEFIYYLGKFRNLNVNSNSRIRLSDLRKARNMKADLAVITGYSADQISLTADEAVSGGIKFHYDNLFVGKRVFQSGVTLPEEVDGILDLSALITSEGLILPKKVGRAVYVDSLPDEEVEVLKQKNPNLKIVKSTDK